MGKLSLTKVSDRVAFRKLAMGSWDTVGDPSTYAHLELDMTNANEYIRKYNEKHGVRVTPTHFTGLAVAKVCKERPEINGMIRGSKIYLRKEVSIFFLVNIPGKNKQVGKNDLSGCTVHEIEKMDLKQLVHAIEKKANQVRAKNDPYLSGTIRRLNYFPWFLSKYLLRLVSFLNYGLNLNLRWLGIPKDPFGGIMITNVGSLGVDTAWAPLTPHTRSPIIITLGSVSKKPWVVDDQVVPRPVMSVGATFDHRFMDGSHAAAMAKVFKDCFENPEKHFGPIDSESEKNIAQEEPRHSVLAVS